LRRKVGIQGMKINMLLGDNKIIKETIEYIEKWGDSSSIVDNPGSHLQEIS
jgi:hypothetical protein